MPRCLLFLVAVSLIACPKDAGNTKTSADPRPEASESTPEPKPTVVSFQGRSIDVEPHIAGFPYRSFRPVPEKNVLLYMHEGAERTLMKLPLDGDLDVTRGTRVHDVDWNTRSGWSGYAPLPDENAIVVQTDESNREDFDLYRLSLDDGAMTRLTDVPYIYGFGLDAPRERLYYVARYPDEGSETHTSCLEWIPPSGGAETEVVCDDAKLNFSWTHLTFSPDGRWVYLAANAENDRARSHMLRVDTISRGAVPMKVTRDAERSVAGMLKQRLSDGSWLLLSDETGYVNLHRGTDETGIVDAFTSYEGENMSGSFVLTDGEKWYVVVALRRPFETELIVLDEAGNQTDSVTVEANLYDLGESTTTVWFYETSRFNKMETFTLTLQPGGTIERTPFVGLPDDLQSKVDHCEVERVSITTFDEDPKTGEQRELHAYFAVPREQPADAADRLVGVVAFYGGGNHWDTTAELFCQAGIATLSPSVRGSWGFGQEFYSLNDKDLGGDEIVDLHWAAKWLQKRGYRARNIGVYGGSHGGYATMRALTFPPETNGRNSDFDFGWGVSWFGFSDIKTFWEKCNIPDWVLLEAGDPDTEPDKIRDRSPLHHVAELDAPILLLHGENDLRVPVEESRQFKDACDAAGKECRYIEFAGQGHGLKGIANQTRVWKETFAYLERVVELNRAR